MKKVKSNIIISDPHVFVPNTYWNPLLGEVLREADLLTDSQLEMILRDKLHYRGYRIGELIALRGWLKQETVDFFAEDWITYLKEEPQYPIGEYLKQAGLLKKEDINNILDKQRQLEMRFGEIAVAQGLIKPKTLNFFLNHLFSKADDDTLFIV
ncbi:MAG: hypothetical protein QNJ64_19500 [Crocosphaera sp.]|nr:hypothetical protein [Crocosphaera sp.]